MIMEAIKTYSSAFFAALLLMLPDSVNAWGDLFNMITAFLALILVIWRIKHDMFKKQTKDEEIVE